MSSPEPGTVRRKHPDAECETCPIYIGGAFVPSEGPRDATLAICGEAPGVQEKRTGRPFVGASGKLLNHVMTEYGLQRHDTLLTNAALCRPADGQTPPAQAFRSCRPRLMKELYGIQTVVVLGNSAAQSVLRTGDGITRLRVGMGKASEELPGTRIIPSFHPAACLRQADLFPHLVGDFAKIGRNQNAWSKPDWRLVDDRADALAVLAAIEERTDRVVVDIEVNIEKDTSFDHPNNYGLLCVGLAYARGKAVVLGENACKDGVVLDALGAFLSRIKIICQNGKFDLAGLFAVTKGKAKLWFDTMLAHYTLDERQGVHSLDFMGVELIGTPDWKGALKRYLSKGDGYGVIPKDVLYEYNAMDCAVTWELMELFEKEMEKEGTRGLHDFLVAASNQLMYTELNGLTIDRAYLDELTEKYLDSIKIIEDDIQKILDGSLSDLAKFNPRSPIQVKKALAEFGITVDSTAVGVLELLVEKLKPESAAFAFIDTLMKHRKEAKLYGTYVKGMRKRMYRGRVYPTFLLHGTTTGRLSCRNPNLQNIPRQSSIRQLFIPARPENVFVQADYSQAELRVVTWLAQDEYFRSIFNDPTRDLFDELTPILYGDRDLASIDAGARKELRIRVKAYVYGLAYGREAYSIAQEFRITEREAQAGMNAFFKVIPGIVEWRKQIINTVMSNKDLINPFGRHRRFYLITDDNAKDVSKEALAFMPQSTSSDICLGAFTELRPKLVGKAFIRNIVHDSILAECKAEDAEEVGQIMTTTMVSKAYELVGDYVRFAAEVKIGKNWAEC